MGQAQERRTLVTADAFRLPRGEALAQGQSVGRPMKGRVVEALWRLVVVRHASIGHPLLPGLDVLAEVGKMAYVQKPKLPHFRPPMSRQRASHPNHPNHF